MSHGPCFVGMDGATAPRDLALRPSGERWAVPNEARGGRRLETNSPPPHPAWAGSHGGPGTPGAQRLGHSGPARRRCAPAAGPRFCTRHRAMGHDGGVGGPRAGAWRHGADVIRPTPRPLPDAQPQELRALLGRRQPLIGRRTADQHRLAGPSGRLPQASEAPMAWRKTRSPRWTTPWRRGAAPARWGEQTTTCGSGSRALGRGVLGRWCGHAPSWGRARGSTARPGAVWRPSRATVGPCGAGAPLGEGVRMGVPCSPWARSGRHVFIRRSTPFLNGCAPQGKAKKSR